MSARRTEQCVSPARASRERASASIALDASTPTPWLIRGASSSSTRPVPVPMSSSRPASCSGHQREQRRLDRGGRQVERAHFVPVGALAAEALRGDAGAFGQHAGGLAAVGLQDRVVIRQAGDQIAGQRAGLAMRQGEPDVGTLAHAVQQAAVAQQLQVAGQARLRLAEDLGELRHAEGAAAGQRQQAQAGRFGGGTQTGQQAFHGLMT